ncbi:UNVERIFIED_CONTAM: hypothetical protein K2H54_044795 [Gekko kuhli]
MLRFTFASCRRRNARVPMSPLSPSVRRDVINSKRLLNHEPPAWRGQTASPPLPANVFSVTAKMCPLPPKVILPHLCFGRKRSHEKAFARERNSKPLDEAFVFSVCIALLCRHRVLQFLEVQLSPDDGSTRGLQSVRGLRIIASRSIDPEIMPLFERRQLQSLFGKLVFCYVLAGIT